MDFANSNIYLAMLTGSGLYAAYESINQTTGACTQGPLLLLSGASYGTMQMDVDPTAFSSQLGNMYVMMAYGGGITDALYVVPTAPWTASSLPTPAELTLDYSTQYGPMVIDPSNHQLYINDLGGSAYGTVGTYATGGFFVYDPNSQCNAGEQSAARHGLHKRKRDHAALRWNAPEQWRGQAGACK